MADLRAGRARLAEEENLEALRPQAGGAVRAGMARAGASLERTGLTSWTVGTVPETFEGGQTPMHMRLPKLRGFTNPFKTTYQVVNVADIAGLFPDGGTVTVADLVERGAVRKGHPVKVLGTGEISVKVDVTATRFSTSAKEKIEAAGGSATQA